MKTLLTYIIVILALFIIGACIDLFIIPHLNPDNKFKIWWKNNVIDQDPHHL